MQKKLDVKPTKPRTHGGRLEHRANAPTATVEEHFRNNLGIPLLGGIIVSMNQRFSVKTRRASKLLYLVPSMLIQENFNIALLEDVIEEYRDDIPYPDIIKIEIHTIMDTDRLGALALMNVHYNHDINYTKAYDLFFNCIRRKWRWQPLHACFYFSIHI